MLYYLGVAVVTILTLLKISSILVPGLRSKKSILILANYGVSDRVHNMLYS